MDQLKEEPTVTVTVKRLKRTAEGKLETENAEVLAFSAVDLQP